MARVPYTTYAWFREYRAEETSWAVWANPPTTLDPKVGLTAAGIGEVGFFEVSDEGEYSLGIGQALRRDVVLIGLNPAAREDENGVPIRDDRLFGCFHDNHPKTVKDHRLRAVAYHWGLWGACIVDLDSITVETSSAKAMDKLRDDSKHRKECAKRLKETFEKLDPPRDALVVLLGGVVEKASRLSDFRAVFKDTFDGEPRRIWHYSYRASLERRIANAQKVLGDQKDISDLFVPGQSR